MGGKAVLCDVKSTEALFHFGFNEERGTLEALISILLKNRRVVLLRVLAALENERHKGIELRVCVVRVVHVSWGLWSKRQ